MGSVHPNCGVYCTVLKDYIVNGKSLHHKLINLVINLLNNSSVHPFSLSGHDVTCTADGLEFLVPVTEVEVLNLSRKMRFHVVSLTLTFRSFLVHFSHFHHTIRR
jgi:hypothetical protein